MMRLNALPRLQAARRRVRPQRSARAGREDRRQARRRAHGVGARRFEPLESRCLLAAFIEVGHHELLPNQPDQQVLVYVSGDMAVQGVNVNVQVADGGPEVPGGVVDGPAIGDLDILTGTIFEGNNSGVIDLDGPTPGDPTDYAPQHEVRSTTTSQGTVITNGLLATITIDTTGFLGGRWTLRMSQTVNGPTDFASLPAEITDGSITIRPPGLTLDAGGTLRLIGTLEDDWARFSEIDSSGQLLVESTILNEPAIIDLATVTSIEVHVIDGNDRVYVHPLLNIPAALHGGPGRDFLWGGSAPDTLVGGAGNDRLWGRGGGDRLEGSDGADRLWGEDGNDTLIGGGGPDRLWAGEGDDTVENPGGEDIVRDPQLPDPPPGSIPFDPVMTDVNFSGSTTPSDVLPIINLINEQFTQQLQGDYSEQPQLDVNADGQISPADALTVVNAINEAAAAGPLPGEGESVEVALASSGLAVAVSDDSAGQSSTPSQPEAAVSPGEAANVRPPLLLPAAADAEGDLLASILYESAPSATEAATDWIFGVLGGSAGE